MNPSPIPLRSIVYRTMLFSVIFAVTMIVTNIVCCVVWEDTLPGLVYWNTDDADLGYLRPGGWVGSYGSFPVITVNQIVTPTSMGDPDEIKAGWSIKRLWVLWWCMFGSTVLISASLGLAPWFNLAPINFVLSALGVSGR